ncbi:hypothetical protein [Micromonospora foliorum]|uniref:hypothetical protein n=1 Tax=Micromonospora foliorum TaxID=2911210 RepID=UPI001EE79130|nr:hypothetical protein [Micromonospora foliorum]MCG5439825.1 hypothetical protein [Micromonospora foliorum]
MKKLIRSAAVLIVAAAAGAVVVATPAQAATTKCYGEVGNLWEVDLPNKTDLLLGADPCIVRDGSGLYAYFSVRWQQCCIPAYGSGHKFDGVKITVRLERRPNGSSDDTVITSRTCDITSAVNSTWSDIRATCFTDMKFVYDSSYDWSADGTIQWDIDNDGDSWKPAKALNGSPLIT